MSHVVGPRPVARRIYSERRFDQHGRHVVVDRLAKLEDVSLAADRVCRSGQNETVSQQKPGKELVSHLLGGKVRKGRDERTWSSSRLQ